MAEPAAVPGVDPSRVNTPAELAACLKGLYRRRGLSYEKMEKAAANLSSRPGGPRLEPLSKSTVGEIVHGKRLPSRGKLLTFLAVCEVAPADLAQWRAAWERARTADLTRPADAKRVRDARPRLLGVHDAIRVEEKVPGELPLYVPRDIDDGLRAELAANAQRGCFVLLVGGSSVGKTRTLYEAVLAALPDWWLVHPAGPGEVTALAAAPYPRMVIWLDELQRYLDGGHGLTGGVIRALMNAAHPAVIIGTLWPDLYNAYTAVPPPGAPDLHTRERQVLDLAAVIRIPPGFSPAEQVRARAAAARDRRLAVALEVAGYGLTQTLAAAPQLVARWQDAKTAEPYAWAVLTAALDVTRLGARAPLGPDLLRAAAPGYCTSQQQAEAPDNWFEQAMAYATVKLHGAASALSPAGAGMGQVAGYTVADYLVQHASRESRYARVPASTWDALTSHIRDPADTARLADSASDQLLYRYAIPLYRHAVDAGDRHAAWRLASLLEDRGDLDGAARIFRVLADAGDEDAAWRLARLLKDRGDQDELRALADAGDGYAASRLADLLEDRGDQDELRALADAGDGYAASRLARLLADLGDLDGLRALADAGHRYAAWRLARLLLDGDDLDELRALADVDDQDTAWLLADLLADRGDLDGLRARADAGDGYAASRLADLLEHRGDLDGLRALADAGDWHAARRLARLLADRGDLDELRALADAGDGYAARRLADLLKDRGDLDGAARILRARADADAGDEEAASSLADLLEHRGDLDGLRALADAGNWHAARRLARLLADRGDLDGAARILRARADTDDRYADYRLADLLKDRGDLDGAARILRARADAGDWHAASSLARLLKDRGDLDELRARADAGDEEAASSLADLLKDRGDLDGLRARADAGDWTAARRLADLLADRGDLEELRARADAGDRFAAVQLPKLLTSQGRGEEAERLRRFGLNPDGSIACE
jgi:hypothetical protein